MACFGLFTVVFLICFLNQAAGELYHITTSSNDTCFSLPCLTLSEFSANSSNYLSSNSNLVFLPGHHYLVDNLTISDVDSFSMTSENSTAQIECTSYSHVHFNHSHFVHIANLEFIGCGGNRVENTEEFVLEHTKFRGREDSGTALELIETMAEIISCSFLSNKRGKFKARVDPYQRSGSVGGAIIAHDSKVDIRQTKFENNVADFGGAIFTEGGSIINMSTNSFNSNVATDGGGVLFSYSCTVVIDASGFDNNAAYRGVLLMVESNLSIKGSEFDANRAIIGGVLLAVRSRIMTDGINFQRNSAVIGGVIYSTHSTVFLQACRFENNTASNSGGTVYSLSSSIIIEAGEFYRNTAVDKGGVLYSNVSNVTIRASKFKTNIAWYGGVLFSLNDIVELETSDFHNNSASWGAVMFAAESNITSKICEFYSNTATNGGVFLSFSNSTVTIKASEFDGNTATRKGGVLYSFESNITIKESRFGGNRATFGGVLAVSTRNYIIVEASVFVENTALWGGVVLSVRDNITTKDSDYRNNSGITNGGVLNCAYSNITIDNSTYRDNNARYGGVMLADNSTVIINESEFCNNSAIRWGGVMDSRYGTTIINSSIFSGNTAYSGGALQSHHSNFTVKESKFHWNTAPATNSSGGALDCHWSRIKIEECEFGYNAAFAGGALLADRSNITIVRSAFHNTTGTNRLGGGALIGHKSNITIDDTMFTNNTSPIGAVIHAYDSKLTQHNSLLIVNNSATRYCVFCLVNSDLYMYGENVTISNNLGSLVTFNANVSFNGFVKFENNRPPVTTADPNFYEFEGGAMTLFQTNVFFGGICNLRHNLAENGAAILSTESKIFVYGEVSIAHNRATRNGGGIYLSNSELNCQRRSTLRFYNNSAIHKGGGIHAISSSIKAISAAESNFEFINETWAIAYLYVEYTGSILNFTRNVAEKGGGLSLEANAKLYVLKYDAIPIRTTNDTNTTFFTANIADYGGAVHVDDDTNSGTCASKTECFFQVLAIHGEKGEGLVTQSMYFSQNNATTSGPTLFGGLLDRCAVSQFTEVHTKPWGYDYAGFTYLYNVSTATSSSISSLPVKVCLCANSEHNCTYEKHVKVKKGEIFTLSLVAVDQIGHPVSGTIQTSLNFSGSGLAEGQLTRTIPGECTNLTFNVVSPHSSEKLTLYASDGPCKDVELSTAKIEIHFLPCRCPIGFQVSGNGNTNCTCECDRNIDQYVQQCDSHTESVVKSSQTRAWISYVDDSNLTGYLAYLNCPFDYCNLQSKPINLNQVNGADAQCAFNRSSLLCGSCQAGLSLSLASSRCLSCPSYWPALLIAITIAAVLAGIALVALLLFLNMTVAVGTLNGLIFYANVVYANKNIFLQFKETNFVTVFLSWLNLDTGIDTCYFPGMDTYTKTWLQLVFPAYVILLVVLVIIISSYSIKFSNLIGKRDPVATLATLILLSYAKLLEICFKSLSVGILEYPDGSNQWLWLPDANVKYFSGKHIPLSITAVLFLLLGLLYTILIFSWQWFLFLPKWKVFSWTRNQKLQTFIETYLTPYTPKHRYWTGLLLLVRAVVYLVAAVNISNNPHISLIAIMFSVGCVVLLKGFVGTRVYRKWPIDVLEMFFHLNILFFALFTWYSFGVPESNLNAAAYISVIATCIVLLLIILYHVYTSTSVFSKVKQTKAGRKLDGFLTQTIQPKPKRQSPPPDDDIHRFHEVLDMIDHRVNADDYNVPQRQHAAAPTHTVVEVHKPHLTPPDPIEVNKQNIQSGVVEVQAECEEDIINHD